jgi:hypothetical protein
MAGKVRCSRDDLNHVVDLFREAIEEELAEAPGPRLDLNKIVVEFRHMLEETCEPVASFEEDERAQELKSEIEALQRKALRLKSTLHSKRTAFIEQVQLRAEQMLEEQRPVIEGIDLDADIQIPPDCEAKLGILDDSIDQLRVELAEAQKIMQQNLGRYTEFQKRAAAFFK